MTYAGTSTDIDATEATPAQVATVGVLAMQGAFREHRRVLEAAGARAVEVRTSADLAGLDGIVVPGGESTTIRKLLARSDLGTRLRDAIAGGLPALGTCAGLIVLAHAGDDGAPPTMGLLDVDVERNGFGRQPASFEGDVAFDAGSIAGAATMHGVFIRAPRVTRIGDDVEVIGRLAAGTDADGEPVVVRQGRIVGATFHPELTGDARLHRWFIEMCSASGRQGAADGRA